LKDIVVIRPLQMEIKPVKYINIYSVGEFVNDFVRRIHIDMETTQRYLHK